ncbi:MAG: helix-turn-helix domain-containing protein [Candidatus Eremiobacteraeota bacterium]|nr:helix-turn-helix domain-containing protein [Candidatus Eremiobacteraeota bacterium]
MELINTSEAARILGVTQRTVSIWLKKNKIPGYKLGIGNRSIWRIKKEELLQFLNSHANQAQRKRDEERMRYFRRVLENATIDDEPFTEEDERATLEAKEDIRKGRTISTHELVKKYGKQNES